ncbi:MAG: isopentenyl phosphate kinase [Candidatus Altiarchaeota archaeon]|nr:isopentenyl phosphate kinase [Candidatus Altiarchaeota archaeon]
MKELYIVKLGGSLITRKDADEALVNDGNLKKVSGEIAQALAKKKFNLIIVHGAGAFGHVPAKKYKLTSGFKGKEQSKGIALTHASMERLNSRVVESLMKAGVNAMAFQPSAAGLLEDGRLVYFNLDAIEEMLRMGVVPVGYGDVLVDLDKGCGILSGDQLVPYLAKELDASRVIIATDYNGIFDVDPKDKKARKIDVITRKNVGILSGRKTSGTDVTGGIKRKVEEILELAERGIPTEIISGRKKDFLKRTLLGEKGLGTIVE